MDRRQRKTRAAIFQAFNKLLEEKHFNNITVQEILDESNVGRSTFYSHFETKDALLKEMCTDIFDHIFSHELHSETSHDFSSSDHGLREKITHLLYHLKDNRENVLGVLSGESGELFMRYFKIFGQGFSVIQSPRGIALLFLLLYLYPLFLLFLLYANKRLRMCVLCDILYV